MQTNRRQFIVTSSLAIAGTGALSGVGGADTSDADTPEDTSRYEYPTMGENSDAPVATVYGSFDCPYTADMVDNSFDEIVSEFVDTDRLQLTFRALEYDENGDPYISDDGVICGQAASGVWQEDPESVWDFFAELWTHQPGDLNRDDLQEIMESAGVDNAEYIADNLENWDPDLRETADDAYAEGVDFTPTIELKGDLGNREDVVEWIEARLDDDGGQESEESDDSSEDAQETETEEDDGEGSADGSEQADAGTQQDDAGETGDDEQSTSGDAGSDDGDSGTDGGSSGSDGSRSDGSDGGSYQCGSSDSDGDARASQSFVFPRASGSRRTL